MAAVSVKGAVIHPVPLNDAPRCRVQVTFVVNYVIPEPVLSARIRRDAPYRNHTVTSRPCEYRSRVPHSFGAT
jgi:hypothetical protein